MSQYASVELEVRLREIIADGDERFIHDASRSVGHAIAEVEAGWVPPLPEAGECLQGRNNVVMAIWSDRDVEFCTYAFVNCAARRAEATGENYEAFSGGGSCQCWPPTAQECCGDQGPLRSSLCDGNDGRGVNDHSLNPNSL